MATESIIDAKFEQMRDSGYSPKEVSAVAIADGLNLAENIKMLCRVFHLDFVNAKEAWVQAAGIASSLDEYQASLAPEIDEALSQLEEHTK